MSSRPARTDPGAALLGIDTTSPALIYKGPAAQRDSTELISEMMGRLPEAGDVLDLGCGPRDQAVPFTHLGFRYVGIDYAGDASDFLADAHALPFADGSFDCVFSYAVLEHLHHPQLALREVWRVLRPGGWFVGTVSQGEPFHASYFHHTPWGLISLVAAQPGMKLVRIWPGPDTLQSLAAMGRYPRVIRALLSLAGRMNATLPWLAPRKMRWPASDKRLDRLYRAGSLAFSIQKQ